MVRTKAQILAGGVSLLALGVMAPGVAYADDAFDQDTGVYQSSPGVNLYTIGVDTTYGTYWPEDNGNAVQYLNVYITCAAPSAQPTADCLGLVDTTPPPNGPWPGMILQTALGANAQNIINANADALIRADAGAWGSTDVHATASITSEAAGVFQGVFGATGGF